MPTEAEIAAAKDAPSEEEAMKRIHGIGFEDGWKAGLKAAAKIADRFEDHPLSFEDESVEHAAVATAAQIGHDIRSLATKG